MLVEIFFVTVIYPGLTHNTPKGPFQGCVLCSLHLQLTGMTQLVITCFNLCLQKCKEEEQSQTMNDWETFLGNPLFFYLVKPPPFFCNDYIWKIPKSLGQELNPSHSCNLLHSYSNTRYFNPLCWARGRIHASAAIWGATVPQQELQILSILFSKDCHQNKKDQR